MTPPSTAKVRSPSSRTGVARRQQHGKGLRSPPKIDPCLAQTHSLPPACLTGRLARMRSGSKSAAVNTQLGPSASEDLDFQLTACTLGSGKGRNSGVGVEGRQGVAIPETCSVQCPTGFFSEWVLVARAFLGDFSCQIESLVVTTGVLVVGSRDD